MSYMTRYDMTNIKQYEEGKQNHYLCSMCGQYSTLDDSVSHRGYNLVCMTCVNKMSHILNDVSMGYIVTQIQQKGFMTKKANDLHQDEKEVINDV